jgi:predicted DNA binding CopG/RHH family protein
MGKDKGQTREKVPEKTKVTVNLPKDLVKAAKIAAIERDLDFQDLVTDGLQRVLKASR